MAKSHNSAHPTNGLSWTDMENLQAWKCRNEKVISEMWRLKEKYHGDYEEYCTVSTSLWENYKETGEKYVRIRN